MRHSILLLTCLCAAMSLCAQVDSSAIRFAATITEAELRTHLTVLASDAFMGRDTGKEGQKMAAAYLKKAFIDAGIPPVPAPFDSAVTDGYFQQYELIEDQVGGIGIDQAGRIFAYKEDLLYFNEQLQTDLAVREVVYLGNGEKLPKVPLGGRVIVLDGTTMGDTPALMSRLSERMQDLRKADAAVVLVGVPSVSAMANEVHLPASRVRLASGSGKESTPPTTQMIVIDGASMDELLGANSLAKLARKRAGKVVPVDFTITARPNTHPLVAENVLAFIEGSDKKDELVVITAHYDHIGVENGVVYNGADDDGTGTVVIMEIAEAFAKAKAEGHGPRRSILVMPVSGEEKGLLGSRYYSDHPVFPLENTVADLNIDMIGRVDTAHRNSAPYIYIIGSDRLSRELHAINGQANMLYAGLELDEAFNREDDPNRFYYRSDHYNFARKGVPSIFYFSGVHEDYHQPGDDIEKIQFDLLHQRALLVFHTAWILANRDQRIVVDKPPKP
ncbi:MAG TPA: M28 family peptidase [Flavobacteriales bacterium]|jgi:hypothetical protein|nr:M28 family peptidase [Flavobacteriales bacterium]MBP9176766.1 M28 family peptidase [Flavobacteriales bacterium]MCC6911570.1 M28 family peptidase [Flavobacteriales bacterium]HQW04919.1 M28 family peptidase [Flavobacteriales bacterium]HQW98088.1 M28 family peptidase [Flavobacteriales bacterium]